VAPELQTQRDIEIGRVDDQLDRFSGASGHDSMRQQRPRIKIHPINNGADQKIAE